MTNKMIATFLLLTALILIGNAAFNVAVDAQCFYRCPEIELNRRTNNTYYQAAQRLLAYPQTTTIILGSSRGDPLLPELIEDLSGEPTLNLSVAGADLTTRTAFSHFAMNRVPVKTVIWFADFFELVPATQDSKMRKTPSLRQLISSDAEPTSWRDWLESAQGLIDSNTTSATMHFLKKPPAAELGKGGGTNKHTAEECRSENFAGDETPESLKTKVNILYQSYVNGVIKRPQDEASFVAFRKELDLYAEKNIDVVLIVNPYHPDFYERLKAEHPEIFKWHQAWIARLEQLNLPHVEVLNFFEGIPNTAPTPKYWNDGVHFSCHSAWLMVKASKKIALPPLPLRLYKSPIVGQ